MVENPACSRNLPIPINLNETITLDLALIHWNGIVAILPFNKNASLIFAERKPNDKLRLLVDVRTINIFKSDDNVKSPVSTLTDAAEHMVGNNLFCKLDCPQTYHFLQMADQRFVEMLAFKFASRTFA